MAVRIKDGMIPYTGGDGIEITNNHVINVLLRELNNLIHVNENRELYVDLQLDDGITPEDSLPVGVTTGRILQEDGRPQSGTILNWKTTSGDQVSLIYANDDCLYYSVNGGEWRLLAGGSSLEVNTKTFFIADDQDYENAQLAYNWFKEGENPLLEAEGTDNDAVYILYQDIDEASYKRLVFKAFGEDTLSNNGYTEKKAVEIWLDYDDSTDEVTDITFHNATESAFIDPTAQYTSAFNPTENYHPTTKQYVDNELLLKQDKLIAGTNISIAQDGKTISATLPGALVYKGNVQTIADLPSSGQTIGDTYFVEGVDGMYSWDGTQWNYVGSTTPSLTNYFNKTVDDSDDITEGSIHLFVTQNEKNIWNNKQDALTAGDNIDIINNTISSPSYRGGNYISVNDHVINNLKPFIPENEGVLNQVLKKTSTGYEWKNDTGNFNPENAGSTGQVLKKTETGYAWANESGGGGGGGTSYNAGYGISIIGHTISNTKPFDPASGTATAGQVLTKTANGYEWNDIELPSGENNVKFWTLNSNPGQYDRTVTQEIYEWLEDDVNNGAIINDTATNDVFIFYKFDEDDNAVFYGTKRISRVSDAGNYTSQYQQELVLYPALQNYGIIVHENDDDDTHTNYLSAIGAPYDWQNPFIPTEQYQPATKEYVDRAASGSITGVVTVDTTGTTYSAVKVWVGTQAQYDLITPQNGVIYNIIPSS